MRDGSSTSPTSEMAGRFLELVDSWHGMSVDEVLASFSETLANFLPTYRYLRLDNICRDYLDPTKKNALSALEFLRKLECPEKLPYVVRYRSDKGQYEASCTVLYPAVSAFAQSPVDALAYAIEHVRGQVRERTHDCIRWLMTALPGETP